MWRVTTTASARTGTQPSGEPSPDVALLGRDPRGRRLPPLRERLCPPKPTDTAAGWTWPLLVALFAGILRLWNLGTPERFVFDETYYPKDAYGLLHTGIEQGYVEGGDDKILGGVLEPTQLFTGPSFVAHPPAGKWAIAIGEWAFGMDSFGWRAGVAILGVLSILLVARIVRRMTGSTLLGCLAGLLMSLDGVHFVESRIALIDLPLMFWMVAAFGCLLLDRDWFRRRLVDAVEPLGGSTRDGWGPALLFRPWRLAAGVCFGIACATKWNGVFILAGFGLLTWAWDMGARHAVGAKVTARNVVLGVRDAAVAAVSVVGVAVATYLASWTGWFVSDDGWDRQWAAERPASGLATLVPDAIRSLWHYHAEILNFHTSLDDTHPYASNPIGWLIVSRPVVFDWTDKIGPEQGCPANECVREIVGIGTPAIWWAGTAALFACVVLWIGSRDWRFGVPLVGVASTWLPWFLYPDRPIFYFYVIAILPWLVIGLTLLLGKLLGPSDSSPTRRMWGAALIGGYLLLVLFNFAHLYPILSDQLITKAEWLDRMWFKSWS